MSRIPLESWKPQAPPPDFVARVDQALDAEATRRPAFGRRGLLLGFAAVAAGTGALWGASRQREAIRGTLVAIARTEIAVARGVIAVAEAGARLAFQDDAVTQLSGEVSYRTEPGADLRVTTPAGRAEGRGACCRVRVINDADADLGTSGPSTLVAVYQRDLTLRAGDTAERLGPGRYAMSSGGSIQTDRDDHRGAIARAMALPPPAAPVASAAEAPDAPDAPVAAAPSAPRRRPAPSAAPAASSAAPATSAAPPASASASARRFIAPSCVCVPGESLCACPE